MRSNTDICGSTGCVRDDRWQKDESCSSCCFFNSKQVSDTSMLLLGPILIFLTLLQKFAARRGVVKRNKMQWNEVTGRIKKIFHLLHGVVVFNIRAVVFQRKRRFWPKGRRRIVTHNWEKVANFCDRVNLLWITWRYLYWNRILKGYTWKYWEAN